MTDAKPGSLPLKVALSALEVPVALWAGVGIYYLVGRLWARGAHVNFYTWVMGAAGLGLVVAITYWVCALRLGARWRTRLMLDAIVIVLGIGAVMMPEPSRHSYGRPHPAAVATVPSRPAPSIADPASPAVPPAIAR